MDKNSRLFQFLKEEKMTDVTLTAEGKQIKAHKLILASASLYFEKLFIALGQQHPVVVLKDVSARQLLNVLEYVYLGECDLDASEVNEFKKVAASLDIKVELNVPLTTDGTSSNDADNEAEISYEDIMESTPVLKPADKSSSDDSEPPNKKIKKERAAKSKKTKALELSPSSERGACPHCERAMKKHDISYHSQHCWKNPRRKASNCEICKRAFELPVSCRLHEKKEHGLHQKST